MPSKRPPPHRCLQFLFNKSNRVYVNTFRHHSAQARCSKINASGLVRVDYFGSVTAGAYDALVAQVLRASAGASAIMARMDGSLTLMGDPLDVQSGVYSSGVPPACIVVRPDQLDFWQDYATALACIDVRCIIFLDSQLDLARHWLLRQSRRAQPAP